MPFTLKWDPEAAKVNSALKAKAEKSVENRKKAKKTKAFKEEGFFKQIKNVSNFSA